MLDNLATTLGSLPYERYAQNYLASVLDKTSIIPATTPTC